jgi:hypothetical protein
MSRDGGGSDLFWGGDGHLRAVSMAAVVVEDREGRWLVIEDEDEDEDEDEANDERSQLSMPKLDRTGPNLPSTTTRYVPSAAKHPAPS